LFTLQAVVAANAVMLMATGTANAKANRITPETCFMQTTSQTG